MGAEEFQRLNNQVLLMIAEYHLTSASQGTRHVLPVLPEGAAQLMPPLDEYLPGSFDGCHDVRVTDRAQVLRVAIWLHRLDLRATYGAEIAASPRVEDYYIGPLLEYFLMPKLSDITLEEVAARVAQENCWDMEISLRDLHEERDSLRNENELLARARDNEQRRETKKTQEAAGHTQEGTPFQPGAYLPVGGAPGLGAISGASHGSRSPRCYC